MKADSHPAIRSLSKTGTKHYIVENYARYIIVLDRHHALARVAQLTTTTKTKSCGLATERSQNRAFVWTIRTYPLILMLLTTRRHVGTTFMRWWLVDYPPHELDRHRALARAARLSREIQNNTIVHGSVPKIIHQIFDLMNYSNKVSKLDAKN